MSRSYDKLWKLMIDKKINKVQLCQKASISTNAMAKLGRDEAVSIEILEKICGVLQCDISSISEIVTEDKKDE